VLRAPVIKYEIYVVDLRRSCRSVFRAVESVFDSVFEHRLEHFSGLLPVFFVFEKLLLLTWIRHTP